VNRILLRRMVMRKMRGKRVMKKRSRGTEEQGPSSTNPLSMRAVRGMLPATTMKIGRVSIGTMVSVGIDTWRLMAGCEWGAVKGNIWTVLLVGG
jgi:hypothetical protein